MPRARPLEPGTLPPRFEYIRPLGAGGMGEVFVVRDRERDAEVALKLLSRGGGAAAARFRHEFRCVADLRHGNLVELGELFEHRDRWLFTMELVDGVDFLAWVRPETEVDVDEPTLRGNHDDRRFDEPRLRAALLQLVLGLGAIHDAGIVHRDIKPPNVLVTPDGRVVLLDFGIAIPERATHEKDIAVGTVDYMAPEQARAEVPEAAADMYAVGVMLYEALCGWPPFVGEDLEVLMIKQRRDPPAPSSHVYSIPTDLDALCIDLLDRDPARRATARQVAERLRDVATAASPRPARIGDLLVGRDPELAALREVVSDGDTGPAVQVVLGAPGIGKTALLTRFARDAAAELAIVSFGRCHEREHVRLDLWDALLEAVARHLTELSTAERAALLPDDVAALAAAFPVFEPLVPRGGAASVPAPMLTERAVPALRDLLRRLSADRQVVMIVDDAQWASDESLALLPRILAAPGPDLRVVLAARSSAQLAARLRDHLAALGSRGVAVSTLVVPPLAVADAVILAERLAGRERAAAVATASGGNPTFIAMIAAGDLGAGELDLDTVLRERLGSLSSVEREALALVALAPGPLRHDVLDQLLDVAPGRSLSTAAQLRHLRLVRTTGTQRADRVEPVNDEIRQAAIAGLDPTTRGQLHARIAAAIAADVHSDPGLRCEAWLLAGDGARAAEVARELVTAARNSVAFARAARACESVLALPLTAEARSSLQAARGDALAAAGEAARAAEAYGEAIAGVRDPVQRFDLARRAAEYALRSGHLARGLELAAPVADALGLPIAASRRRVLASLLVDRARLRVHGLALRTGLDPAAAVRADACHSLSTGLAMVDFLRATWFQTRGVRHALDSGDRGRAARALSIEATFQAFSRGDAARVARLLDAAEVHARAVSAPIVDGLVAAGHGLCDFAAGDHAAGLAGLDAARTIFRERCHGAVWEDHTVEVFALWALAWLGQWRELRRRRELLAREATATQDVLTGTFAAIGFTVMPDLGDGDPAAPRARTTAAMAAWGRSGFETPHFHALIGLTLVELASGRGAEAQALWREQWAPLRASGLLRGTWFRALVFELRARVALAVGELDEAAGFARRLARFPWLAGPAALIEGLIAAAHGDQRTALARLDAARLTCEASGLAMYAAAALDRHGALVGGAAGDQARDQAARRAHDLGASAPSSAFAMLAPAAFAPATATPGVALIGEDARGST